MSNRVLILALLLGACTTAGGDGGAAASRSPSSPGPDLTPSLFVRTCQSRVVGSLGSGWRRGEIGVGPVVFVGARGYADDAPDLFEAPGALATAQKVLVVVRGGRAVDISVRHPHAALFYDPARWGDRNLVPFRRGDPRVRFQPCGGARRHTQFNGSFLLRGPACVPVEVRPQGGAPRSVTISFGAGICD